MLFNSLDFLLFFAVVVAIYFAVPNRFRWALLLGASYYFYACWKAEYLLLLAGSTLIDYVAGLRMGKLSERARRRKYLLLSVAANLGILFGFKYFNFFSESVRSLFAAFNIFYDAPVFQVLLPVGISFYTFQSLSYTIDVYRGRRAPERHIGIFALYISFFPQLVAGPIERSTGLLPQFRREHRFDAERVAHGATLALWGFFKKCVIADRLGAYVGPIYGQPGAHHGFPVIVATYMFAYQLYCDFSGYSDIALGTAEILGYRLTRNFCRPFASRSIREFWQRWHVSLTRWIFDYVYGPLAKRYPRGWRRQAAMFFVFILIGLWHGAAWNFMLFGVYIGLTYTMADATRRWTQPVYRSLFGSRRTMVRRVYSALQVLGTFHVFVGACVLFRSQSVGDIGRILGGMFRGLRSSIPDIIHPGFPAYEFTVALAAIGLLETVQFFDERDQAFGPLARKPIWFRWSVHYALLFIVLTLGEFNLAPFVYFQF